MATSTVEDYLKSIYVAERRGSGERVTTGRIAAALEVSPGTVTAMMKTLTESGLVDYEPYSGVRLTQAGAKLATHVLRRHRLIEQFLVEVLKMDWSEVHEEAEVLEHAVSERLIERIDEMLGRPTVDPHGDPIPTPSGLMEERNDPNLLACPRDQLLEITRVTDQRVDFLQLLERHGLMPGRHARILSKDSLTETVRIQPEAAAELQLGFQAASRILARPAQVTSNCP